MKVLLINPGQLGDAGEDQFAGRVDSTLFRLSPFAKTYFGIPLALPTLAGVTPPQHSVKIVDEMVERIDFDQPCDVVGISAMTCKATRAYQIAREFRARGVPVVMGGIHASMCPEEAARHVDCVVVGEADEIWASILEDLENGRLRRRYDAASLPDLSRTKPPRHDLSRHTRYFAYLLQTTRGCPRDCSFCTVTRMNGRRLRKKTAEQVVAEVVQALEIPNPLRPVVVDRERANRRRRLASGAVFFVDDNFAIDRTHALEVCRALRQLQDERGEHLSWFTQVDLNAGFDDELLAAMKDSGCMNLFVGIESLSAESLKAMKKNVNAPTRYAECIRNIERHGIEVTTSVIVGTDAETADSGREMAEFALRNEIVYFFPNILTPYPGTVLMREMEAASRIRIRDPEWYNVRNVVFEPKQMTPLELQSLYVGLCERILNVENLLRCAGSKLRSPKRYYLTAPWRLAVCCSFTVMLIVLALRGVVSARGLMRLLARVPGMILFDGSLNALGFIANIIAFSAFSRGERRRLPKSSAVALLAPRAEAAS